MTSNQITIALTKGRIEKDTVKLLEKAGFDMSFMADKGRNLIFESPDNLGWFVLIADISTAMLSVSFCVKESASSVCPFFINVWIVES